MFKCPLSVKVPCICREIITRVLFERLIGTAKTTWVITISFGLFLPALLYNPKANYKFEKKDF